MGRTREIENKRNRRKEEERAMERTRWSRGSMNSLQRAPQSFHLSDHLVAWITGPSQNAVHMSRVGTCSLEVPSLDPISPWSTSRCQRLLEPRAGRPEGGGSSPGSRLISGYTMASLFSFSCPDPSSAKRKAPQLCPHTMQ